VVKVGTGEAVFDVHFSKASNTAIHLYRGGNVSRIARVKNANTGDVISFHEYDSTSRAYKLNIGDIGLLENANGYYLQIKIISIMDDSRGAPHDEVVFDYVTGSKGRSEFVAL
ncbi:MAG: hypothetical protein ACREB6_02675, partial [Rhodospirillales bacterium]